MAISQNQSIPCPVCSKSISFDTTQLLMGVQFICPNCNASVGLASESKPLVQEAMGKFEKIKDKVKT